MSRPDPKSLAVVLIAAAGFVGDAAQAASPSETEIVETLNRYLGSIPAIRGRIEVSGPDGAKSSYSFQKGGRCGVPLNLHIRREDGDADTVSRLPLAPLIALLEAPRTIEGVGTVESVSRDVGIDEVNVRLTSRAASVVLRFSANPVALRGWTQTAADGPSGSVTLSDIVRYTYFCPQPGGRPIRRP